MSRKPFAVPALVVVLAVFAGTSLLYTPLPDAVTEQGKLQIFLGGLKIVRAVANILTYFGPLNYIENMEWMIEIYMQHVHWMAESSLFQQLQSEVGGVVKVTHTQMAGVPVIIYRPVGLDAASAPATVYFHGGGFVLLSAHIYNHTTYHIAHGSWTVVVSVDYRLAPRHPFPAAVYDCLNVTTHLLREGHRYGIDVHRIGVAGDSAGGNLAAVVSLQIGKMRKQQKSDRQAIPELPSLKFQALFYPVIQAVDFWLPSYVDNNHVTPAIINRNFITYLFALYFGMGRNATHYGPILARGAHVPEHARKEYAKNVNRSLLVTGKESGSTSHAHVVTVEDSNEEEQNREHNHQRGDGPDRPLTFPYGEEGVSADLEAYNLLKAKMTDPMFSPLFSSDVSLSPPTYLHVAEFDVLRDEGLLYGQKLSAAGVKVESYFSAGGVHGEITKIGIKALEFDRGERALQEMYRFVKGTLKALRK